MNVLCTKQGYIVNVRKFREVNLKLFYCRSRGNTYVWTFNLKSRERPSKWILGGVALLLQA